MKNFPAKPSAKKWPIPTVACIICLGLMSACATFQPQTQSGDSASITAFAEDAIEHARLVGAENVLVVFDIDNTLLAMEQGLGSDQWYEWQKHQFAADRCDPRVVSDRLAVQGALYYASAMRPTSPDIATQVRRIQNAGITTIALTSRGSSFRLQTFRELRRNGLDFRRSGLSPVTGWPDDFIPEKGIRPTRYEDGVYLTAGQHKGLMLEALIEKSGHKLPAVIYMLDDKQENVDAIHETFDDKGVAVRSWRYSAEDNNVMGFDADASHEQWQQIAPALQALENTLGTDHYDLPDALQPDGCDS